MNKIAKLITLVVSACMFFPAYAQTESDMQKHLKTIEDITGKPASEDVKKHAPAVQNLIREDIRKRNPGISEEQLNKETNDTINDGIKLFGQMRSNQSGGNR